MSPSNPLDDATIVVPFRLASSRFPRKPLAHFRGLPLLAHTLRQATALGRRVVVTAPAEDLDVARAEVDFNALNVRVLPSSASCGSATDRLVEIYPRLDGTVFVSLPVDEPALNPEEIRRALAQPDPFATADAVTFYCDFVAPEDYQSPLSAKVVTDANGMLLYMSRAIIPVSKDGSVVASALKKNVGAFVFRRPFLEALAVHPEPTSLDRHEGLEQLRWLELSLQVRCLRIHHLGFGIDVPEQISLLETRLQDRSAE